MKTNIYSILAVGALVLGLSSCDEGIEQGGKGEGNLALSDMTVVNDDAMKLIKNDQSRAVGAEDLAEYQIEILDEPDAAAPFKNFTYKNMPEIVPLPAGTYTVKVESQKLEEDAWWKKPYFMGTQEFTIEAGKISNVAEVVCHFEAIKVTVEFSDELLAMTDASTTVTVECGNHNTKLSFTKSQIESGEAGFFKAIDASTTMAVEFNGKIDGAQTVETIALDDVAKKQHRIISFSTRQAPKKPQQEGTVNPGISLNVSMITEELNGDITIEETILDSSDRPGKEDPLPTDPDDPTKPDEPVTPPADPVATFTSATFNLDGVNAADEFGDGNKDAKIHITCPKGFAHLNVTIDSETLTADILSGVGLAGQFDLAEPGALEDGIAGLGLPVGAQVVGQTELDFDITQFMPLLGIYGAANHNFILDVEDKEGGKASLTLKIVTKPL